ncbi:glycoside hydrolase family 17 protein [Thalassotalea agarivorans]|uniref:Endo-1,3-beta-glucanase btgC n=1 Tax=Thalassotalea agarivorans TaxID=349064 RepID=A0A1I0DPX3_THASX|nr:glycosyl hydrolase family 17 protein [Thalassotalea agarivorans]SET34425.1 Exo-beta-1,3-glucanase, GH17 family [Thalassotalea agarivorans]
MNSNTTLPFASAICYSGYRDGQNPREGIYPTYQQVKEDLLILQNDWCYLRLYDCGPHAQIVIDVIQQENLPFKLMLGADIGAEQSNPNCPWGSVFSEDELANNQAANEAQIDKLIMFANDYPDIIAAVSIGNEASVDWTDHLVPVERLVYYAQKVKSQVKQPVTFCENYVPWCQKLQPLADVLDFISIHTYPAWEYQTIENALAYTIENYQSVANQYPGKQIVITEAGWTTSSNGRGIDVWNASPELQSIYYQQLLQWSKDNQITTFIFEAFDEPWKGSDDVNEPEKHWGIYDVKRQPKLALREKS